MFYKKWHFLGRHFANASQTLINKGFYMFLYVHLLGLEKDHVLHVCL